MKGDTRSLDSSSYSNYDANFGHVYDYYVVGSLGISVCLEIGVWRLRFRGAGTRCKRAALYTLSNHMADRTVHDGETGTISGFRGILFPGLGSK